MTFAELKANIRKAKRVYVSVQVTDHDEYRILVKKNALLDQIKDWEHYYGEDVKTGTMGIVAGFNPNNRNEFFFIKIW